MEFEGTVVQILPPVKGVSAKGEWTKQEVIFEQKAEFGRKVCVGFWGDKAQDAAALKIGDTVTIYVNIESREYNGRWYTEVRAWRFAKAATQAANAATGGGANFDSAMPPLSAADEEYSTSGNSTDDTDDLPF